MTLATLVNRLKAEGTIEQVRVNRYKVNDTARSRGLGIESGIRLYTLVQIHEMFCEPAHSGVGYIFRASAGPALHRQTVQATASASYPVLRRIARHNYHSTGGGTGRQGIESALRAIAPDADGVRRSFGLEWEIGSLSREAEDRLVRLLDTLPAHVTEKDASLTDTGVEIVFMPMSAEKYIQTWTALQEFCRTEGVGMNGAGAHTTYGVSNAHVTISDLQIRINRIALTVKAASTQRAIRSVFGRDFTGYAQLPRTTIERGHSNAWSASRGDSAYELRLCQWEGNVHKIVEFMKATEFVFNRPFTAQDFMNIFAIMGSNVDGE